MKKYIKPILVGTFVLAAIVTTAFKASANGSYFIPSVSTATATSTVLQVAPQFPTIKLTYDSYVQGSIFATDRASLLVNDVSSTSASVLGVALQYSQNGVDWYDDNLTPISTATSTIDATILKSYIIDGVATANATSSKIISVATPTRFVRAVFSSIVATSSVWAQFVPIRQVTQ